MSTLTEVGKKLIPALMDDFKGFKASLEEVTTGVVETAKGLQLEVEQKYNLRKAAKTSLDLKASNGLGYSFLIAGV